MESSKAVLSSEIPVSFFSCTVSAQVAVSFPTFAVIVALPSFNAVTLPFASTVATLLSLLSHVTALLSVVSAGSYFTDNVFEVPFFNVRVAGSTVIFFNGLFTVIFTLSLLPAAVAVIVAFPTPTASTLPFESTVTTSLLELFHVIV